MTIQESGRITRPTSNPNVQMLTAETARDLQAHAFSKPCGWSVGFALEVQRIVDADGPPRLEDFGESYE